MTTPTRPRLLAARREMVALARRTSWSEVSDSFGIELLQLLEWAEEVDKADGTNEAHQAGHAAAEKIR